MTSSKNNLNISKEFKEKNVESNLQPNESQEISDQNKQSTLDKQQSN